MCIAASDRALRERTQQLARRIDAEDGAARRFPPSNSYFTNPHRRTFMPTDSLMGYALLAGAVFTPFLITVGLVEAVYFINVAFMALFVFATPR
jgi:hypothetical protein